MAKKSSRKRGAGGRSVSKVKRDNQKRNKLIKKGKLKPNSKSPFLTSRLEQNRQKQARKAEANKRKMQHQQANGNRDGDDEEEGDDVVPDADMMDPEDAFVLKRMSRGAVLGGDDDKSEEYDRETRARRRFDEEDGAGRRTKALLPIKTAEGVVAKTMEVEEEEDEAEEEDEEDENEDMEEDEEDDDGPASNGLVLNGASSRSVVSLLAEREQVLDEFRTKVGVMATSFVEAPEENLSTLERLVATLDKIPVQIKRAGFKMLSSTVTELLKDVIPAYKIQDHEGQEGAGLQKKETLRLQKFESGVLRCAKSFLVKMERLVRSPRSAQKPDGLRALDCLCAILTAHPQFNYSPNLLRLIVPLTDSASAPVRERASAAVRLVMREDKKGESSLVAARLLRNHVKSKKYRCRPDPVECFLSLRLNYIERAMADAAEEEEKKGKRRKKSREEMSKRERKRQKQLQKVEREMLEARGEESKQVRNRNYTEVAKVVFEVLFRIIKSSSSSEDEDGGGRNKRRLLPSALKCVSTFCHCINVDFFDDLLRVMSDLVRSGDLARQEELQCVKTAFDILSGPGEFLTYDPGQFAKSLYALLPDLRGRDQVSDACSVVGKMLVSRKRLVSADTVRCFSKALATAALQMDNDADLLQVLQCLSQVKCAHLRTFESLLDPEEEEQVGAGAGMGLGGMDGVTTVSLWEMGTLCKHPNKEVVAATKKLLKVTTR